MAKESETYKKKAKALGRELESEGNYALALSAYKKGRDYDNARRMIKKIRAEEAMGQENYRGLQALLYDGAKALMVLSGIGLVFSLFSKPQVISAENVQLAPPLPNYMIYVLAGLLIASAAYLFIKQNRKKKSRIPLSF